MEVSKPNETAVLGNQISKGSAANPQISDMTLKSHDFANSKLEMIGPLLNQSESRRKSPL